jgi:phage gp36-like protein
MPAYTDLARLTARYGADMLIRVTDRAEIATGQIDESVVTKACDDAMALIDGYLAGRYALPLDEVPPLVSALAEDIAIWRLHAYDPDPKLKADFEAAMRSLRDISDGRIRLTGLAGVAAAQTGSTGAMYTDRERPLTEATMKGYI